MKLKLLLLLTIFWTAAATAEACVCMAMETCELPIRPSDVFIGKVLDLRQEKRKSVDFKTPDGQPLEETLQISRVLVSEVFKGGIREKEILIETDNFTTCWFSLKKDVEYLFYAYKSDTAGRYVTGSCSGTKPLAEAAEDVKYLNSKSSTVEGEVSFWAKEIKNGDERPEGPSILARIGISAIFLEGGDSSFRSTIGPDGKFSFANVPAGDYRLRLPLPRGYRIYEYWGVTDPPKDKDIIRVPGLGCKPSGVSVIKSL